MKTIDRQYINLRERFEEVHSIAQDGLVAESIGWEATADGQLDTGENIYLTRFGKTAQNAYRLLEMALAEQDWRVA